MLPLYDRIDKLCKDSGTNITQMCKAAGVPRSALSEYKAGRNKTISFVNLQKIADYFGLTVDELVNVEVTKHFNPNIEHNLSFIFNYLCYKNNLEPAEVLKEIGIDRFPPSDYRENDTSLNDAVQKVADYFSVSIGYILQGRRLQSFTYDKNRVKKNYYLFSMLSPTEQELILAQMQGIIDSKAKKAAVAARNGEYKEKEISAETAAELEKIINEV